MSIRPIEMTLQQIFITNLKKNRNKKGISQMLLAEKCETSANYISEIEMGRRIPSFDKIEKIATALEIPSHELFIHETAQKKEEKALGTKDFLRKMPAPVKKDLIARLLAAIKKDINDALIASK